MCKSCKDIMYSRKLCYVKEGKCEKGVVFLNLFMRKYIWKICHSGWIINVWLNEVRKKEYQTPSLLSLFSLSWLLSFILKYTEADPSDTHLIRNQLPTLYIIYNTQCIYNLSIASSIMTLKDCETFMVILVC